jgi:hypothetical protein
MEQLMPGRDLVEADLTCLMCGRMIGQLAGLLSRGVRTERTLRWSSFRAATANRATVLFTGRERFRCQECGGAAVTDAISVTVTRESMSGDNTCPVHRDRMRRRGRPPRGCLCYEVPAAA